MTAQCAVCIWVPCKFYGVPDNAHGYFTRNFQWAFVPIEPINVRAKFEIRIALPVPEIIGGTRKIGQSLDTPTLPFLKKI